MNTHNKRGSVRAQRLPRDQVELNTVLSDLRALGQIDAQASPSDVRFRSQQVNV